MEENLFKQQMRRFDRWKADLIQIIQDYHFWLQSHDKSSSETDLRLFDVIESLKSDHLTIAFVAEFSRGKTELINAIFFSDYKRRLLPSEVGRTTMCPTELFYDHNEESAYIRLLPIETRKQESSIAELKRDLDQWHQLDLDVNSPEQMSEALKEVVKTKIVSRQDAIELGLYKEMPRRRKSDAPLPEEVEVPQWRHAMISFPHPLLQQGLSILDTPGLNALGTEPELTLNMLPNAQAVLFILAADTGVTQSDLEVWEHHIKEFRGGDKGLVVALNKIDTLWDEMKTPQEIDLSIDSQCTDVAKALSLNVESVFPLSAQKALVAKTRGDDELLEMSRLVPLEQYLAKEIIPARQSIVRDHVVSEVGHLIRGSRNRVGAQLKQVNRQLIDLQSIGGKNVNLIKHMMHKAREKQAAYNKNMEYFQSGRRTINQQATLLLNELSLKQFDRVVEETRRAMSDSWTTAGLTTGMKTLFEGIRETMEVATRHANETHNQVVAIYQKFQKEHELADFNPMPFSTEKYAEELDRLYGLADEYRTSPVTTMTEQGFVIKKFFISLVSHVRDIFYQANQEADAWFKDIMIPLARQVTEYKQMLEQHMETLYKVNESKDNLVIKSKELSQQRTELKEQFLVLDKMYKALQEPIDIQDINEEPQTAVTA